MTGSGKPRVSMVFPCTNFISSSRFAGSNARYSARAIRERPMPPERAAVYTRVEASRRSHGQLFPKGETAVGKFDSINPAFPTFANKSYFRTAWPHACSNSLLPAAPQDRLRRCATPRYVATHLDKPKVDGMRGSGWRIESFGDLMARGLSSPRGNFSRLMCA